MNKIVNGIANDYEFPMYYEPKISTNRQAGKTQQMFYELTIELNKKQQELDQYKNNWEELKKYIKNFPGISYASSEKVDGERLSGKLIPTTKVLNKMKELEEKNND